MTSEADRFRCIRCDSEFDGSERTLEHVYGYSIGGALTIQDVCKPCNDVFGAKYDAPLVDHLLVQLKRHRFNIAGHDGHVPDPLATPGIAADDPDLRIQLQREGGLRILPSVKRTFREDRSESKTFLFDEREPPARDAAVRKLIRRSLGRGQQVRVSSDSVRRVGPSFRLTVEERALGWAFGLVKIAYELAYDVAGPAWLDDEAAVSLRTFLQHSNPTFADLDAANLKMRLYGPCAPDSMDKVEGFEEWHHQGAITVASGHLEAEVRVFETFGLRMVIAKHAAAYSCRHRGSPSGSTRRTGR